MNKFEEEIGKFKLKCNIKDEYSFPCSSCGFNIDIFRCRVSKKYKVFCKLCYYLRLKNVYTSLYKDALFRRELDIKFGAKPMRETKRLSRGQI